MQNVVELTPDDFVAERFRPLFESVWQREAGQPFDASYFFPQWRLLMDREVARTWAVNDSAVLGALFVRNIYSGRSEALCQFWFTTLEVRHTGVSGNLMEAFGNAARQSGCVAIHSAAYHSLNPVRRETGYLNHGFVKTETLFSKEIN